MKNRLKEKNILKVNMNQCKYNKVLISIVKILFILKLNSKIKRIIEYINPSQ